MFDVDVDFCVSEFFVSEEVFDVVRIFGLVVEFGGFPVSEGVKADFILRVCLLLFILVQRRRIVELEEKMSELMQPIYDQIWRNIKCDYQT